MYFSVFIIGMHRPTYTYISVSTLSQGFHVAHFFHAHCKSMRNCISNLHVMPKKKKKSLENQLSCLSSHFKKAVLHGFQAQHSDSRVYSDLRTEKKKRILLWYEYTWEKTENSWKAQSLILRYRDKFTYKLKKRRGWGTKGNPKLQWTTGSYQQLVMKMMLIKI